MLEKRKNTLRQMKNEEIQTNSDLRARANLPLRNSQKFYGIPMIHSSSSFYAGNDAVNRYLPNT